MKITRTNTPLLVLLLAALLIASCGGGGGDDTTSPPAGPSTTSEQIQAARDAADGLVSLPVDSAVVTYATTTTYSVNDPAGFFIQADKTGPALFIAVDPATLTPVPVAGDVVDLVITEMGTYASMRKAITISGFSRIGQGASVTALTQDVNAATDLVSALSSYDSEMITTSATISSSFVGAGISFVAAPIMTAGVPNDANLRLRMPDALQTALTTSADLMAGCVVTLPGTPLWMFNTIAQVSAWTGADIAVDSCPAPAVVSAASTTTNSVRVTFSRAIASSSITSPATQFTFNNGLTASGAVVNGRVVDVTTGTQTPSQSYTVTVAGTVTDVLGAGVDGAANSAVFSGYVAPPPAAALVINEVDYDNVGLDSDEFVEIYNNSGGAVSLTGYLLNFVNGANNLEYLSVDLSSAGTISANSYLVVSSSTVSVPGGTKIIHFGPASNNVQNGSPDGIALVYSPTETLVDALSYEGDITSTVVTGITASVNLVEGTATSVADVDVSSGSLNRCPNGSDTDDASTDWLFVSGVSPGAANVCP